MSIIINPGSGPVDDASLEQAALNMRAFADDLTETGKTVALSNHEDDGVDQGDGRWRFHVTVDGHDYEIDMPGAALHNVRFMNTSEQNIWHFPRLYVDGSSWVWCFALAACEPDDEDEDE